MLQIEHFSKIYAGEKRAVDDLSLTVRPGEIFGFIGHNGAGKTTTLRSIAGILDFEEGTITIDGHDVQKDPVAAKRVTAFLPEKVVEITTRFSGFPTVMAGSSLPFA